LNIDNYFFLSLQRKSHQKTK